MPSGRPSRRVRPGGVERQTIDPLIPAIGMPRNATSAARRIGVSGHSPEQVGWGDRRRIRLWPQPLTLYPKIPPFRFRFGSIFVTGALRWLRNRSASGAGTFRNEAPGFLVRGGNVPEGKESIRFRDAGVLRPDLLGPGLVPLAFPTRPIPGSGPLRSTALGRKADEIEALTETWSQIAGGRIVEREVSYRQAVRILAQRLATMVSPGDDKRPYVQAMLRQGYRRATAYKVVNTAFERAAERIARAGAPPQGAAPKMSTPPPVTPMPPRRRLRRHWCPLRYRSRSHRSPCPQARGSATAPTPCPPISSRA